MAFQATTFQMGIMLHTLKASSRLPHLVNISMRALLTPTSDLEPLQTICSLIVLPSSSAATLALTAEDFWVMCQWELLMFWQWKMEASGCIIWVL
jgi:hypothetical protein